MLIFHQSFQYTGANLSVLIEFILPLQSTRGYQKVRGLLR